MWDDECGILVGSCGILVDSRGIKVRIHRSAVLYAIHLSEDGHRSVNENRCLPNDAGMSREPVRDSECGILVGSCGIKVSIHRK